MKLFREYRAYVSFGYRILAFVVIPVLILGLCSLISPIMDSSFIAVSCLAIGEIALDGWGAGPLLKRNASLTTLMQSSFGGREFMRKFVIQDLIIRTIEFIVVAGLSVIMSGCQGAITALISVLIALMLANATINIIRYFESPQYIMFFGGIFGIILGATVLFVMNLLTGISIGTAEDVFNLLNAGIIGVLIILNVVVSILTYFHHIKRIELSYYDENEGGKNV